MTEIRRHDGEWSELTDARLVWMDAEVAVYRRQNGSHASYVCWRDGEAGAAGRDDSKSLCLLELRTGIITACESLDEAHRLVAELERKAGRAEPEEKMVCE